MKLHSDILDGPAIFNALRAAKTAGKVTHDIYFVQFNASGSRSRARGFDIQLGTDDRTTGPTKSRRYKNSGKYGADAIWAATYDEWGWFIAYLFDTDPDATFGPYKGQQDFEGKTRYQFIIEKGASAMNAEEFQALHTDSTFCGWANWDTRNAYNWLTSSFEIGLAAAGGSAPSDLEAFFRTAFRVPDAGEDAYQDGINPSKVNWQEIFNRMHEGE